MRKEIFLATVLSLVLAAPANAQPCASNSQQMARTELFFGADHVSLSAWRDFMAQEVTPRFPYGLTVLDGYGQWMAPGGHISKEKSHVLLIWHGFDQSAKIDAIRDAYKERFHQQSVMRVDGEDCVSF
jgi:hypothetical protein